MELTEAVSSLLALRSPMVSGSDEMARAHIEGVIRGLQGDREIDGTQLSEAVSSLLALRSPMVSGTDQMARAHIEGIIRNLLL